MLVDLVNTTTPDYRRAEQLVSNGESATLLEVQFPLPYVITAAGYVEKYGADERYNFLKWLIGVRCPTLITLGEKEVQGNIAFQGLPQDLEALAAGRNSVQIEILSGADHFYAGVRAELANTIESWLRSQRASEALT